MNGLSVVQNAPTEQEIKWVELLAAGRSYHDIAREYDINKNTFAYKMTSLRERYGCENSASLVAFFIRNKLIE